LAGDRLARRKTSGASQLITTSFDRSCGDDPSEVRTAVVDDVLQVRPVAGRAPPFRAAQKSLSEQSPSTASATTRAAVRGRAPDGESPVRGSRLTSESGTMIVQLPGLL